MRIGLTLETGGRSLLWRSLDPGALVVGSNPDCDLCVPDPAVGPVQCVVRRSGATVFLENRDPRGTKVGLELIQDNLQLADGDEIWLGPTVARVRFVSQGEAGLGNTRTLTGPPCTQLGVRLTIPDAFPGRAWEVGPAGLKIGSDTHNDIVLEDAYVSSFHAMLTWEDGRCMVRDLGSRNGVFLGGQKLREGEVPVGKSIQLGQTTLFVSAAEPGSKGLGEPDPGPRLLGRSKAMAHVRDRIGRLAKSDAPVLVTGETGTGKDVVANLLVRQSPRAQAPLVAINCGSLSRQIIESELFGHEKGAFTGAISRKIGAFEAAHTGTLFLDEIGELPLELQPQLLRVLESGEVRRVGSTEILRVDVRVIAATNRALAEDVAHGRFREDLFHRLHVLTVELPPLRDRIADLEELAACLVSGFAPEGQRIELTSGAMAALRAHLWPGNVRELRNTLQRAVLLRRGADIDAADITFAPTTLASRAQVAQATSGRTLDEIERMAIITELQRAHGNKKEAAVALGISRSTIHRKIDELAIDTTQIEAS